MLTMQVLVSSLEYVIRSHELGRKMSIEDTPFILFVRDKRRKTLIVAEVVSDVLYMCTYPKLISNTSPLRGINISRNL